MEWEYADRVLMVDLCSRSVRVEPTSLEMKRSFVGGAGFVASLLDGCRDRVVMAAGPLSDGAAGRLAMGAGRSLSSMGGKMAAALKASGYDAIVIDGALSEPGYLTVGPSSVEVRSAGGLWGLDTQAASLELERRHCERYASMVIGPAAENRVAFATLAHDGHFSGGSGVAAALGAKQLKALLVMDPGTVPSRCFGCTLHCPAKATAEADACGVLGLDAPTAGRLADLARACASVGLLPAADEPLHQMAYRIGVGEVLAGGEAEALARLGPEAERIAAELPSVRKRRGAPGLADLLGVCQRVWHDRPGQVLRSALVSTQGLLGA
ncbi:MAG TPA: aldehyde ferredoxin oxidoreductase N-terminal domain-containing protein [Symbiobacteriaceae bacterium]|nr:aldehyde ferredoxin oxidoreductase N-terminal domain-containing protein [Symbiobacteriaceae bacterium]